MTLKDWNTSLQIFSKYLFNNEIITIGYHTVIDSDILHTRSKALCYIVNTNKQITMSMYEFNVLLNIGWRTNCDDTLWYKQITDVVSETAIKNSDLSDSLNKLLMNNKMKLIRETAIEYAKTKLPSNHDIDITNCLIDCEIKKDGEIEIKFHSKSLHHQYITITNTYPINFLNNFQENE